MRLDRERALGPGEPLARRLLARHGGQRRGLHGHVLVEAQRQHRLGGRVSRGGVRGVAFLPEELAGAQEHPGPHLPPEHVGPLVQQQRQVPVRADPLGHHLADDRFRRRPDDQWLLQLLAARVGDREELGRESLDVLGLALHVALRDEQREVGVLVPGGLDPAVQVRLQQLPDPVPVRPDHHAAADRSPVHQLGAEDHVVVPGREVLALRGYAALVTCHDLQVTECSARPGCCRSPPCAAGPCASRRAGHRARRGPVSGQRACPRPRPPAAPRWSLG